MSTSPTYFNELISNIRLTPEQVGECREGHTKLRERLAEYEPLKNTVVATFLQGSYKRNTAIKPKGDKKSDVDIVVVTNLSESEYSPDRAINKFIPFVEKYYPGKIDNTQGRSIGIKLTGIELDLVITSAPSETQKSMIMSEGLHKDEYLGNFQKIEESFLGKGDQWKNEPLRIPDREAKQWQDTNPLAQIFWTIEKNKRTNGHYVNVVKVIKWWQRITTTLNKYPKGYPLEHIIGDNCPDGITSVGEGIVKTLEGFTSQYAPFINAGSVPESIDRGTGVNVLHRLSFDDFSVFYKHAVQAYEVAIEAYNNQNEQESVKLWSQVFGDGKNTESAKFYTATRPIVAPPRPWASL